MRNIAALAAVALIACGSAWAADYRIEMLDATSVQGTVTAVSADKVTISSGGKSSTVDRLDVLEMTIAAADDPMLRPQCVLLTAGGDVIVATELVLKDGTFEFTNPLLGKTKLPMDCVSWVLLDAPQSTASQIKARCTAKLPSGATRTTWSSR